MLSHSQVVTGKVEALLWLLANDGLQFLDVGSVFLHLGYVLFYIKKILELDFELKISHVTYSLILTGNCYKLYRSGFSREGQNKNEYVCTEGCMDVCLGVRMGR